MEQVCNKVSAIPTLDLAVQMAFRPDRLKEVRELKKYTQDEVAEYLGVTYQFYSAIERGKKKPNAEHLAGICTFLSCSSDYLLGFADKPWERLEESKLRPDKRNLLKLYDEGRLPPQVRSMLRDSTFLNLIEDELPTEDDDKPNISGEEKIS